MQGQKLVSTNIQGNSVDLEAYGLSAGMYIWSSRNRQGEVFTGKISKK
jgi:hypothetical protein